MMQAARVYLRVSTEEQDLARQEAIVAGARAAGVYVAAVYREKASGARPDRPELLRMVADLQPCEVVVAEHGTVRLVPDKGKAHNWQVARWGAAQPEAFVEVE